MLCEAWRQIFTYRDASVRHYIIEKIKCIGKVMETLVSMLADFWTIELHLYKNVHI